MTMLQIARNKGFKDYTCWECDKNSSLPLPVQLYKQRYLTSSELKNTVRRNVYKRILKLLKNEEAEERLQPFNSDEVVEGLDEDDDDAESGVENESPGKDFEGFLANSSNRNVNSHYNEPKVTNFGKTHGPPLAHRRDSNESAVSTQSDRKLKKFFRGTVSNIQDKAAETNHQLLQAARDRDFQRNPSKSGT